MIKIHGWTPVDKLPPTDSDGESDFCLVICKEASAPVVAYYSKFDRSWTPAIQSRFDKLTVTWWKLLEKIPVSILPNDRFRRELALNMGMAFVDADAKEEADETRL